MPSNAAVPRSSPHGAGLLAKLGVLAAITALGVLFVVDWPLAVMLTGPVAAALLLRGRLAPSLFSPVRVMTGVFAVVGFAGYLIFHDGRTATGFYLALDRSDAMLTAALFATTIVAITVGAVAYLGAVGELRRRTLPTQALHVGALGRLAMVGVVVLPLVVAGRYLPEVFSRADYHWEGAQGTAIGAVGEIALAAILVLGYFVAETRGPMRAVLLGLAVIEWLVLLSLASRGFAMAPVAFFAGMYAQSRGTGARRGLLLSLGGAVLLLPLPLYLRGLTGHGLVPYLEALQHMPYSWREVEGGLQNLFFGFLTTGVTAFKSPDVSVSDLGIAINPGPGRWVGWYEINERLRIASYMPFSGIGTTWNAGPFVAVAFWLVVGVVLGWLERRVIWLLQARRQLLAIAIVGLVALSSVLFTQYNVRNASRPLWYALGLGLVATVLVRRPRAEVIDGSPSASLASGVDGAAVLRQRG